MIFTIKGGDRGELELVALSALGCVEVKLNGRTVVQFHGNTMTVGTGYAKSLGLSVVSDDKGYKTL